MIYSPSRLETYRQCPQKFKFSYIDQIPSSLEGIEAFMGSRVHEALEKLYTSLKFASPMSLEDLLAHYRQAWEKEWHEGVQIVREGMTPDMYLALGEQCLSDYYHRYDPFKQSRTLGIEYPVRFNLDDDGNYAMQGYLDRLSQPEAGILWIHDYKTKGFFPTQQDLDADLQLAYYQMAIQKFWPDTKEVLLIWHYLIFDQEFHSRRTADQIEALRQETIVLIQEIEAATEFPPKKSGLCHWCEYQSICPLFRHLYETKTLAKNDYEKEAGVSLAGRLVALQAEEADIKREMEKVKSMLVSYAEQKGIEVVFTKTHKVRIKVYENIRFPGRHDPGRAILEKTIKEGGKWEEVSMLDLFALSKTLQSASWKPEWVAGLKKMGTTEKSPWVKVSPRDERN